MKIIPFLIRIFLDAYRDTKRVVNYFNLVSINGIIVVPKLYFIRLFYSLFFVRNLIKIKIFKNIYFSEYFLENNISSKDLAEIIDIKGYSKVYTLKKNFINDIKEEIFSSENIQYKKNKDFDIKISNNSLFKRSNEDLEMYFVRLKNNNISRVTGFLNLNKKESNVRKLLTSDAFISLAQNFLNTKNFSINASFFISNPVITSKEEQYANAQYFHWDNDFTKFLKIYIYLSDVDQDSGPHILIPYTHKKKLFRHSLCRLYEDKDIYNFYNQKVIFTGGAGSLFFSDGYGLHKGEMPKSKSRLILNIHYGRNKILYSPNDIYFKS